MTITAIEFSGKGGTYIVVKLLHRAMKGHPSDDIIFIDMKSLQERVCCCMTAWEALVLANGLINAVTMLYMKREPERRLEYWSRECRRLNRENDELKSTERELRQEIGRLQNGETVTFSKPGASKPRLTKEGKVNQTEREKPGREETGREHEGKRPKGGRNDKRN